MNILITTLLVIAVLFARLSQKEVVWDKKQYIYGRYKEFFLIPFLLSFCILAGLCFFCKSGTDMSVYVNFYCAWTVADFSDPQFEIGDRILFVFLHSLIKNPYVGLGIVKIFSIALVYRAIYLLRNKIKVSLAVSAYIALLYIFNFHLIRMMIAIGLVFLALTYELIKKRGKCIILLIIAILFHYTSCIVFFVYLIYLLFLRRFSIWKIVIVSLAFVLGYINVTQIVSGLTETDVFSKYTTYAISSRSGSGIVQIVLFIPVALILLKGYRFEKEMPFYQMAFLCGVMTFYMGSMGYIYAVIGRLVYYFYFFFVIYGAAMPLKKNDIFLVCGTLKINVSTILVYVSLLLNIYIYYVVGDGLASNGLVQYSMIFS